MNTLLLLLWHASLCLRQVYASTPSLPPPDYNEAIDNGTFGFYPQRTYMTEAEVKSPETNFLQWNPLCDDGLFTFITPRGHALPRKPGPMILDGRGELVWGHHYDNEYGGEAYNFLLQKYKGEDVLTFWLGDDRVRGHGAGHYYFMNSSYDIFHNVTAANGLQADLHEFLITPDDTALMTIYEIVPGDVSMFRSFNPEWNPNDKDPNYIWDGIFQEINIETGELLFEWRASEHFNFTETYRPIYGMGNLDDPFDWFHINSIQKDELGNYLVSARYTHSITYIDGKTKETIWQLGGRSNSFLDLSEGQATNFAWQHDARFHPITTFPNLYTPPPQREGFTTQLLTVFDNSAEDQHYDYGAPLSRGLLLELTYPTPGTAAAAAGPIRDPSIDRTFHSGVQDFNAQKLVEINGSDPNYAVRVIHSYENPHAARSSSQGSVQLLPPIKPGGDPRVLVGYGLDAVWTEFDANGTVLCDVHYGPETSWDTGYIQSYRVYKFDWTGTPEWEPSVAIDDGDDELVVHVSWLGATEVVEWALQCSHTEDAAEKDWVDAGRFPKVGFESRIPLSDGLVDRRYLRVLALAEDGKRLSYGTSRVLDRGAMASDYLPPAESEMPTQTTSWPLFTITLFVVTSASTFFVVFVLYKRFLTWRSGRPGADGFRWWKRKGYKLLGEV